MENSTKKKGATSQEAEGLFVDKEAVQPDCKRLTFTATRRITMAGGFLDIALFTANCEQLKFVLELGNLHIYYEHVLALLLISLLLQLLVGLTLFLLGCQAKEGEDSYSNVLNHITMGLVALITIVNIFISTFGPKGTVMARCLGAFSFPKSSGPVWTAFRNATRLYMSEAA